MGSRMKDKAEYVSTGEETLDEFQLKTSTIRVTAAAKLLRVSTKGFIHTIPEEHKVKYRDVWFITLEWVEHEASRRGMLALARAAAKAGQDLKKYADGVATLGSKVVQNLIDTRTARDIAVEKALKKPFNINLPPVHIEEMPHMTTLSDADIRRAKIR